MPIKQLLIQPFQTLFIRWSKAKTRVPKFPTTEKGQWSVIILVSVDEATPWEDINQLAVLSRNMFGTLKILAFSSKDVSPVTHEKEILLLTWRDFTFTGKLSGRIHEHVGNKPADLLVGLSEDQHPLFNQLINQLSARFKAGIAVHEDNPGYQVTLRVVPDDKNLQRNLTQLMEYLINLKIQT